MVLIKLFHFIFNSKCHFLKVRFFIQLAIELAIELPIELPIAYCIAYCIANWSAYWTAYRAYCNSVEVVICSIAATLMANQEQSFSEAQAR